MSTEQPSRYKAHISKQGTPTDKDDWLNLKEGHDQVPYHKDGAAKDKEGQVGGSALSPFLAKQLLFIWMSFLSGTPVEHPFVDRLENGEDEHIDRKGRNSRERIVVAILLRCPVENEILEGSSAHEHEVS